MALLSLSDENNILRMSVSKMSKILFSLREDKIHIFKPLCNFSIYYIYSMQKAVNDVIDIFTSEDMENTSLVIF